MLEANSARMQSEPCKWRSQQEREGKSLRRAAEALVMAYPGIRRLPDDHGIEETAAELGLEPHELVVVPVAIGHRAVDLVVVPTRTRRRGGMPLFFELKASAATIGRTVVLVPESFVRREPRLTNAFVIAEAAETAVGATDRMRMLVHLIENGGSAPLLDLAGLVNSVDPVAGVLGLVVEGGLHMDLDARLMPSSQVHLVEPGL